MEYSLRDAYFLFWLIKEKGITLPVVQYQCDYIFFDTHSYFIAINELPMTEQLKKRLQGHLNRAKEILEMANYSNVGAVNTAIFGSFFKSTNLNRLKYLEVENVGVKGKPVIYHCLTYLLELDLETFKPKWVVVEDLLYTERLWNADKKRFETQFKNETGKEADFYEEASFEIFGKLNTIVNELTLLLNIKKEHPHRNIIDSLIPKYIDDRYREELEHIFSFGKYSKEQVKWLRGYKELQEYLYPHYNNETIPHKYSQNWYDFVMKNFTQKNGRAFSLKSLQNSFTRPNWRNNSRNSQNHSTMGAIQIVA
jgi:hypothetical protein